jgi:exodeoxyribonuclease V alpha subunit
MRQAALVPSGSAQALLGRQSAYPQPLLRLIEESDLDETRAYLAWQLGEMAVAMSPGDRSELVLLCARLLAAEARGSTRLALNDDERAILARVPELVGEPRASTPLVADRGHLYTRRAFSCEERIAAALGARLAQAGPFSTTAIENFLRAIAASASPPPSLQQTAAVVQALTRLVGIISGGPGTGKTTTALSIVRCLVRLGVPAARIALAAPTGKAASRMEDDFRRRLASLDNPDPADLALLHDCPKAQTLHRLLGVTGDTSSLFRAAGEPLPFRAIIVDESSMVDLVLMDHLLGAVPITTPVVFLGDADQLPSVSAGAVFRDLAVYAAPLVQGFRTGSSGAAGQRIAALAAAVRAGDVAAANAISTLRLQARELRHDGVEHLPSERRAELLRAYYHRHFANPQSVALANHVYSLGGDSVDAGFAADDAARLDELASRLGRARILTVTRERAAGAVATNAFLHDLHGGGPGFLPGEPVLMLRNDYRRELWNGDQGIAILLRKPGRQPRVAVAFRSRAGWLAVDPEPMGRALGHGYALTAHRSQGSEYDEVVLLLPDFACPILTRELLYTAVSRARRSAVLCGSLDMMNSAIATKETRDSGLAERLLAFVTPLT